MGEVREIFFGNATVYMDMMAFMMTLCWLLGMLRIDSVIGHMEEMHGPFKDHMLRMVGGLGAHA